MDFDTQKETWSKFKKLTLYVSVTIVFALALMATLLL
jgi:hypothetical protein